MASSGSSTGRLNVNAATFVPSCGVPNSAASDESSGTTWQTPLLQFGSLPEALRNIQLPNQAESAGYDGEQQSFQFPENGGYEEV